MSVESDDDFVFSQRSGVRHQGKNGAAQLTDVPFEHPGRIVILHRCIDCDDDGVVAFAPFSNHQFLADGHRQHTQQGADTRHDEAKTVSDTISEPMW